MSTNIRIVLVRPRDPNNIGAVARAMKNFGFSDLWVVSPLASTWGEVKAAVNATDVLANARIAVADASDRYSLALWGRNIFDRDYWTAAFISNGLLARNNGAPATFGMTLSARY